MIAISEIAFTVYPVTDMARARAFYEGHFGLKPTFANEFPNGTAFTEYEIGTGAFSLGRMPEFKPTAEGANISFEVVDFDAAVNSLKEARVQFVMEPLDTGVCRMALILDTEGNKLMIHKRNA